MVKSNDLQSVAISHFKGGEKAPEIAKLLTNKADRVTIHRWLCRYKQSGPISVKPKSGRPRAGRTKRLINLVKTRLNSNVRRKSIRTMTKDFKSTYATIRRVLVEDLGKKCYRKINVQKLKQDQKPIRKQCCTYIRKNIDRRKAENMMVTDEKIFTKNGYINPKNDVVWADSRCDTNDRGGVHEKEKFPASIMIAFGATWNRPTEPYFFRRING
ncbi:unnamed protein product [Rotaria socialis]|uniref:Transposase n=1 Tax=Rotaria socialis TaxID=392032 RepID=A0A818TU28_9BILA|nr:unnamed protein product [Rotaria socialis]CAF4484464.1 unnamed protein product [Rotaria socialis]